MTLLYVMVTGNLGPAAAGARVFWTPTAWLTDAPDLRVFPPAPLAPVTIAADGTFTSGPLLAQDSTGPQPAGEAWQILIEGIGGVAPLSQTYAILHANGATQDLSTLVTAVPSPTFTNYLLGANNLSDVASPSTALANLGGATPAQVSAAVGAEATRAEGAETTLAGGVAANAAAIAAEATRATTAEGLLLPKAGGTVTGPLTLTAANYFALDGFSGSDDQKMTAALAAGLAAKGGTIQLAARAHTFAAQWATTGTQATPLTICGAGGIATDSAGTTSYGGATTCAMSYAGSGAARMDFQHRGSIEITGILFQDSGGSSVPFFQTTLAVPNVHHNAFIGSATGTACFQDAIVLGGFPGTGSGDTAQYDGYQGAVYGNSFSGIRRAVLVNPAANSVQVWGNTIGETCGSNLALGAAIELLGTSTLKVLGCWVYGNCIEETFYQVAIKGTWAQFNTLGPNGLFDAGAMYAHHYLDANSVGNVIIMGEGSGSVPAVFDAALTSTVIQAATGAQVIGSVTRTAQAFYGVPPVVQANGQGVLGSDVQGDYGTWRTGFDQDGFPLIQAFVIPGTKVADGSTISGSNVVTSLTAAWTVNDLGVYISGTNLVSGSVIMLTWNATTGPDWQASTAYAAGQVVTPASNNGHLYQCTTAGTSGSSQPAFPTNGTTVTDGTAVWTDIGASSAVQVSNNATGTGTALAVRFGRKGTSQSMTSFCRMHMLSSGTAPTVVAGAAGPAGTGATASVTGNDMCHVLTLNTGTGTLTAGVLATVTFALSYDAAPKVQLTQGNAATAPVMTQVYKTSTTATWVLNAASGLTPSTTYVFDVTTVQ